MVPPRGRVLLWSVAALGVLAACGGDDTKDAAEATDKVSVQLSPDTKEVTPVSENDVKITSTDGALVLAVIGDSVIIQLSDSLRQSVADSAKKSTADQGGIGAIIGNAVSAAVNTAMGFKLRVPARAVENLRYENGELLFNVTGEGVNIQSDSKGDSSKSGGRFSEEDARRFIDAVKAAQGRRDIQ